MSLKDLGTVALLSLALACAKKAPETPAPEPEPAAPAAPAAANYGPVIDAVLFETGGTKIAPDQMQAIEAAAEVLRTSDWTVLVVGLADASGDAETNKVLSQQRAEAVADELRKRVSVPAERIVVQGIGEKLATGSSQSERKVEFVFFRDKGLPLKQVVIRSGVLEEDFRAKRATKQ